MSYGGFWSGVDLNGVDKMDVPPPLPVKGSTADYGNLLDNQDLSAPTATTPPPHQRVRKSSIAKTQHLHYLFFFYPEANVFFRDILRYEIKKLILRNM